MNREPILPALGIDIGTTGIALVMTDLISGKILMANTVPNDSTIVWEQKETHTQDADRILSIVCQQIEQTKQQFPNLSAIGITGQMHGILYIDADGNAISPLYTWQDASAGIGTPSACDRIKQLTGYSIPPGYGLATHFYHLLNDMVPTDTTFLCTIMDYIGIRLCRMTTPIIHCSNAAALGFYRPDNHTFDQAALTAIGIDPHILPTVTEECMIIGRYHDIPVSVSIGDNQASFIGSVKAPRTQALANIGTGSQISVMVKDGSPAADPLLESRPLYQSAFLHCGSALCGGRAYALLENFFASYAKACGISQQSQYETMNRLAKSALSDPKLPQVITTFCGTRADPTIRGGIFGLSEDNFTPQGIIAGTLYGIANELHKLYQNIQHESIDTLILSGNGARNNPVLCRIMGEVFGLPILLPTEREEAARGAALFSAVSAGLAPDFNALSHCITYTKGESI